MKTYTSNEVRELLAPALAEMAASDDAQGTNLAGVVAEVVASLATERDGLRAQLADAAAGSEVSR